MSRAKFKLTLRLIKYFVNKLRQDTIVYAMCEETQALEMKQVKRK